MDFQAVQRKYAKAGLKLEQIFLDEPSRIKAFITDSVYSGRVCWDEISVDEWELYDMGEGQLREIARRIDPEFK